MSPRLRRRRRPFLGVTLLPWLSPPLFFGKARRMFEGEMASLTAILRTDTVRVPKPIKVLDAPGGGSALVMEHVDMRALDRSVPPWVGFALPLGGPFTLNACTGGVVSRSLWPHVSWVLRAEGHVLSSPGQTRSPRSAGRGRDGASEPRGPCPPRPLMPTLCPWTCRTSPRASGRCEHGHVHAPSDAVCFTAMPPGWEPSSQTYIWRTRGLGRRSGRRPAPWVRGRVGVRLGLRWGPRAGAPHGGGHPMQ